MLVKTCTVLSMLNKKCLVTHLPDIEHVPNSCSWLVNKLAYKAWQILELCFEKTASLIFTLWKTADESFLKRADGPRKKKQKKLLNGEMCRNLNS